MEVDEDDSDLESPHATDGASKSLDSAAAPKPQTNTRENSNLDSVNFSWLKEYFA